VEFNGLPALSNGYIVDGLETNDPLTNLNSGLSTNLVLGLNSISEVTVNTLSYAVDQGRYGASQVNYVTKSGSNQFSRKSPTRFGTVPVQCNRLFHECHSGKSQTALNRSTTLAEALEVRSFATSCFSSSMASGFASRWPIVTATTVPTSAFESYVLQAAPIGGNRFRHRVRLSVVTAIGAVLSEDVLAVWKY